jgi:predicted porin
MALYKFDGPTVSVGYEHIEYQNPHNPLLPGTNTIGGYTLAYVNNDAYATNKTLQVLWLGGRYPVTPQLDVAVAYYGVKQNSYATGALSGCGNNVSSACSGNQNNASLSLDYHFTKRFDTYFGFMWSQVANGIASGYLQTSNVNPTLGVRYQF